MTARRNMPDKDIGVFVGADQRLIFIVQPYIWASINLIVLKECFSYLILPIYFQLW